MKKHVKHEQHHSNIIEKHTKLPGEKTEKQNPSTQYITRKQNPTKQAPNDKKAQVDVRYCHARLQKIT